VDDRIYCHAGDFCCIFKFSGYDDSICDSLYLVALVLWSLT